jgi:hypothetical protein
MNERKGIPSAHFYYANLAPFPGKLAIAKEYTQSCPEPVLRSGLACLHNLITRIYRSAAESPEDFVFPQPSSCSRAGAGLTEQRFVSIPLLLYFLGLHGRAAGTEEQAGVEIENNRLAEVCRAAKIKEHETLLASLGGFGVAVVPSNPLVVRFPQAPDIASALPVFARACRPFAKKDTVLPVEFGRLDLRVLAFPPGKKKFIPTPVEEAIRLLDEEQAAFLAGLDAWAKGAGYRPDVKYGTLHNAAWRANYRHPKLGKALFGFAIDGGHLAMHLNFNQAGRIMPQIRAMPAAFQDIYFEKCTCADCGQCVTGPLEVEYAGRLRRICGYSYLNLPEVPAEFQAPISRLLHIQDELLKQDAQR